MSAKPFSASRERSICVLIPVLNEVENLAPTVNAVRSALLETVQAFEITIVDDHSTDGTAKVADALAAEIQIVRVFHNPTTRGIGYAYLLGYENTACTHFVYIPCDNTCPYGSFRNLCSQLGQTNIFPSYSFSPQS